MNDPLGLFEEETNNDPLGLFEEEAKADWRTAFKTTTAGALSNIDKGFTAARVAAMSPVGLVAPDAVQRESDALFREREERERRLMQWANPDQLPLSTTQQVATTVATAPLQILGMFGAPAAKGMEFIDRGESLEDAQFNALTETALNVAGVSPMAAAKTFLGRAGIGAGANVALGAGSDAIAQLTAENPETVAAFDPYNFERRLTEAVAGGVLQGALGERPTVTQPVGSSAARDLLRQQAERDRAAQNPPQERPVPGSSEWEQAQLRLAAEQALREQQGPDDVLAQTDLFDQPEQGRVPMQFEATPGDWRIDENGMPVRVDLSMEAQNLEQPLQRNLFGDELDVQVPRDPAAPLPMDRDLFGYPRMSEPDILPGDLENTRPLTEAIDSMDPSVRNRTPEGRFAPGTQRGSALERLQGELEASGPLEAARIQAETLSWLETARRPVNTAQRLARTGRAKRQGGGITTDIFGRTPEISQKLQDVLKNVPYRFQSLETLPNKERVTAEQIKQIQGRQEVTEAEKRVVSEAYAVALHTSDANFVSAADFAKALEEVIGRYTLMPEQTSRYADFGLDQLGRNRGREFDLESLSPEQLRQWEEAWAQGPDAAADFMNRIADQRDGVESTTRVWESQSPLAEDPSGHFPNENYVGHTRSFTENGVRHVVEIQSDLLQRKGLERDAKTLQNNWAVRLIREELADAAKRNEPLVRFATADTVAKVEGWPDQINLLRENIRDYERRINELEKAIKQNPDFVFVDSWKEDAANLQNFIKDEYQQIKRLEEQGQRFSPVHQGIYNRYQKDVQKYLDSIGGEPVMDKSGNTWTEVKVDPSRRRPIMFGQRGAVLIDWGNKADNALVRSPDGTYIPNNPDVQAAIKDTLENHKDIKVFTYLQSGSTSTAMKTGNPVIKAAGQVVQNALKRAELNIRAAVFPVEESLRKLKKQELIDLGEILKDEMFNGRRIDGDLLANTLTEKQAAAYVAMRDMFDKALDAQNAARVALGKEPITAKEAYLSSRWNGPFRQPVYDAQGKLVWYLAANTQRGLNQQVKALKKQFPDLVADPKLRTVKGSFAKKGQDLDGFYTMALDILGRDDPAVAQIQRFVEEQTALEGEMTLGQTKHFKNKSNVRGFTGDRPGVNQFQDILEMFQQQIQYGKNAFQWSEMQKAGKDIKEIVGNPELQEKQPNTVKYVREYFKNALGFGESELARAFENTLQNSGVSLQAFRDAIGNVKSFFILQKLAVSAGYTFANVIQTANVLPYIADLTNRGYVGNPLKLVAAPWLGVMMGSYHGLKNVDPGMLDRLPLDQFTKDAIRYAEDNGVTARSIYDEAPIEDAFSMTGAISRQLGKTMTIPEVLVRSTAFMAYANWLKDSGKFTDMSKLFEEAEALVNKSMVDYRESERPLMFAKAGAAGNMLNTLQTFPMSFYNQFAYMWGQAMKGKPAGLAGIVAFQLLAAGLMGLPYVQDMEKLLNWMRDNVSKDSAYVKMMESPFFSNPRAWIIENLGEHAAYGALSVETGLGMTSRVAAPNPSDMIQAPLGPITDIAGQVGALGSALMDPTNKTKWAQSAMKSAPVGLQGLLETAPFMEGITYNTNPQTGEKTFLKTSDLADRDAVYTRTPEEVNVRQWGLRSQREVAVRQQAFSDRSADQVSRQRSADIANKFYNAARNGDTEKAKELAQLYTRLTGKEISSVQMENQLMEEFTTSIQKNALKANTPLEMVRAARTAKLIEEMDK